jgi:hypothetical protein
MPNSRWLQSTYATPYPGGGLTNARNQTSYGTVVSGNPYDSGVPQCLLNSVHPYGVGDNVLVTGNIRQ